MNNKSFTKNLTIFSRTSAAVVFTLCSTLALAQTFSVDDTSQSGQPRTRVLLVDDDHIECPSAGFTTIQAAVNAARPGDTVQVCPGTYDEQVEIAKRLTLEGVERNGKKASVVQPSNMIANADLFGPVAAAILVRDTSDVTIRNITADGINNGIVCDPTPPYIDGIFYRNASGEIESVAIKNILTPQGCAYGDAIDVLSTGEQAQRLTIRESSLHDYDGGGIICFGSGLDLRVLRNVVTGNDRTDIGQAGIQFIDGASGLIEGNTVMNTIDASCPSLTDCGFVSSGIGAFSTADVKIAGNTIGKTNVGIFVGSSGGPANDIQVLDNRVFDTDIREGISVTGENSLVKDNVLTDCARAGVRVRTGTHRIQRNTINETPIGLLVNPGNNLSGNQFFNTPLLQQVLLPVAPVESTQAPLQQTDSITPSVLRKKLSR